MLLTQSASFNRNVDLLMANSGDLPESESVDLRDRSFLERPSGREQPPGPGGRGHNDRRYNNDRWEEPEEEMRLDDEEEE
jgi:hypothetical protein